MLIGSVFLFASPVFSAETASVLPSSIFRARIVQVTTEDITDKFGDNGKLSGLSNSLNRSVTFNDFAKAEPSLYKLAGALNAMEAGLGESLLNSQMYSETKMNVNTTLLALEYGVNKKLTLGLRAPITNTIITSKFSVTHTNNAAAISKAMGNKLSKELTDGLETLSRLPSFGTKYFQKTLFTDKGYRSPQNQNHTALGDIEVGAKYQFLQSPKRRMSAQVGLRLPTGEVAPLDDLFYQGTGDGTYAIGALVLHDYDISKNWTTGVMAKVVQAIPDTRARAVPKDEDDALPSLLGKDGQVQDVTKTHALDFESEVSLTYTLDSQKWSFWGALQYLESGRDEYTGAGDLYYQGLENGTEFQKSDIEFGLGYSSIPAFKAKKISVPLKIEGLVKTSLQGKNVPLVSYARMDLIVFF